VIPGLILLALLAGVTAVAWRRLRRRLGLGVSRLHWAIAAVMLAAAVFALWITAR
jgi:hypothetical protein